MRVNRTIFERVEVEVVATEVQPDIACPGFEPDPNSRAKIVTLITVRGSSRFFRKIIITLLTCIPGSNTRI